VLQRRVDVLGELARLGLVLLSVVREGRVFVLQVVDDIQELCGRLRLRCAPVLADPPQGRGWEGEFTKTLIVKCWVVC